MYTPPKTHNVLLAKATARYAQALTRAKIAEPSFAPHACNVFCVPKKEKVPETLQEIEALSEEALLKTYRIVMAFFQANANIKTTNHTVSSLRDEVLSTRPNMISSSLDLFQAFFQMVVDPKCRDYLSFHVPGLGALLRLCRAPMGLIPSSSLLTGLLYHIKDKEKLEAMSNYQDDINIDTPSYDITDEEQLAIPEGAQ